MSVSRSVRTSHTASRSKSNETFVASSVFSDAAALQDHLMRTLKLGGLSSGQTRPTRHSNLSRPAQMRRRTSLLRDAGASTTTTRQPNQPPQSQLARNSLSPQTSTRQRNQIKRHIRATATSQPRRQESISQRTIQTTSQHTPRVESSNTLVCEENSAAAVVWTCSSCTFVNHTTKTFANSPVRQRKPISLCEACGARQNYCAKWNPVTGIARNRLTLAQKRGLVKCPAPRPDKTQWQDAFSRSLERDDSCFPCPICQQEFGSKDQVITSCSHVFHRTCIESFERYALQHAVPRCPVCRTDAYERRACYHGAVEFKRVCAVKIQRLRRGVLARRTFKAKLHALYASGGGDSMVRRKRAVRSLGRASQRIAEQVAKRGDSIDRMFAEWDRNVHAARKTYSQQTKNNNSNGISGEVACNTVSNKSNGKEKEEEELRWQKLRNLALDRGLGECAICVTALPEREMSILSCSHVLHQDCIASFEAFTRTNNTKNNNGTEVDEHRCPLCRESYDRRLM